MTFYALAGGSRHYADVVGRLGISCFGGDRREVVDHGHEYASVVWPSIESLLDARHFDTVIMSPWTTAELAIDMVRGHAWTRPSSWTPTMCTSSASSGEPRWPGRARWRPTTPSDGSCRCTDARTASSCVTDDDATVVRKELPGADIVVVPNAHADQDCGPDFEERSGCLFVGNFNHLPNGDAVEWWSEEIGPALARRLPRRAT